MKSYDCKYNKSILCDGETDCKKCGWNPDVAKERKEELHQRRIADVKKLKSKRWRFVNV